MPTPHTREWVTLRLKLKDRADSVSDYLNQLEKIFTEPMNDEQKLSQFNSGALYAGKLSRSYEIFRSYVADLRFDTNQSVKARLDSVNDDLKELTKIFTVPMTEEQKICSFNTIALYTGRLMIAISNVFDILGVYNEMGPMGGDPNRKKKSGSRRPPAENKEDKYEFKEADE